MPIPRWKLPIFSIVVVALGLGLLEAFARLVVDPPDVRIREEHEAIIDVLGLRSLNETMEFDPLLFWRLRDGLHDFRVHGRMESNTIDFRVSTESHLRRVPGAERSGAGATRILALGDSCTFGLGVDDGATWPAALQRLLAGSIDARVINAGVPGYTAYQGRRLLESRAAELAPDIVVATFGFNDIDVWGTQSDYETARALGLRRWERLFWHSRLYLALRGVIRAALGAGASVPTRASDAPESGRARLSEREFRAELEAIAEATEGAGADLVLMVWPYGQQIRDRFPPIANYQPIILEACEARGVPCVNLIEVFLAAEGPLFLDHVHANPRGNAVAARAVREALVPLLARHRETD